MGSTRLQTPSIPVGMLKGTLPEVYIAEEIDHFTVAQTYVARLGSFTFDLLTNTAMWRDLWALTGTSRTFYGSQCVYSAWSELLQTHHPHRFSIIRDSSQIVRVGAAHSWIQARFTFETAGSPGAECSGFIGLVPGVDGKWNIWLLSTILERIQGFPSSDILEPQSSTKTRHAATDTSNHSLLSCVVIGAGMAGLSVAGRLQALGVSYVVLEKNDHVGDNWTHRYESAKLHTPKSYGHLPFSRTFPPEDPYFLTKNDLARGFQRYVNDYGIKVCLSVTVESASLDEEKKIWTVYIRNKNTLETSVIRTRHLVLAIGPGGQTPKMPELPNRELFKGEVLHSVDYKSATRWNGKAGVVVGSANTAHDVASDMVDSGLKSVVMVQRSRTGVIPVQYYTQASERLYNDEIPTEIADRFQFSLPIAISRQIATKRMWSLVDAEPERFDALERVGFKVDRYSDLFVFLCERMGGHYLDVGCSAKIAGGLIKMKSDARLTQFTPSGLEFSDGSHVDADVIIFATGFESNMRLAASSILGRQVTNELEDFWGVDEEGELLGAWKPLKYPGLWYTGGAIGYARYFSRFLALQILADISGAPFQRYTKTPI